MATFLSPADLAYMREMQKTMINEIGGLGRIKRPTRVKDGRGGYTETYVIQENVPMRLWISSGPNGTSEESRFWGEQEINETDAFVVLYWDADIDIKDIVEFEGRLWKVTGLQYKDAHWTAIRARVVSIRASGT